MHHVLFTMDVFFIQNIEEKSKTRKTISRYRNESPPQKRYFLKIKEN